MLNRVFLLLCFLYFFSSCQEKRLDFINISFTPTEQYEIRNSGEIIHFSIKLSSNSDLSNLVIVQIVNSSIIDTIHQKQISGFEETESYIYTCPDISSLDTSSEFNSYNLLTGTGSYNSDTTTHISDNTDSISDILSREWISISGLLFSKNNSFDYANATLEGVINAYNTSVKKEFVDQISVSDIIITKIENNYVIIKIINVEDDPNGSENDRYIFNIKQ